MDNYSAVQFIEDCQRACKNSIGCNKCLLYDKVAQECVMIFTEVEERIKLVHQWAIDNPIEPVKEERKEMTKADLKTGMIVEFRNGDKRTVFLNILSLTKSGGAINVVCNGNEKSWNDLNNYKDDLTNKHFAGFDIMKIYQPSHPYAMQDLTYDFENWTLLWEREEKKVKTYVVDFYEKFPEARTSRFLFYPYKVYGSSTKCDGCNDDCPIMICWNRPMEGKG